ncbi:hypothetical protein J1614_006875 [Plenodomus biglobosus]|nr:hypothetical protein J1614_006875 [Plenodomus biglobosus]
MSSTLNHKGRSTVRASRLDFFFKMKRESSSQAEQVDSTIPSVLSSTSHLDSEPPSKRKKSEAMASSTEIHLIIRFYDQSIQAKDSHGRTQQDIMSWSDTKLERSHNYIQMLFPLPEGSPYNWAAPVVTREVFNAFRSRTELRDSMRRSFERMLEFYGFTASADTKVDVNSKDEDHEGGSEVEDVAAQNVGATTAEITETSPEDTESNTTTGSESTTALSSTPSTTSYAIIRGPKWRKNSTNWCVRFDHNHLRITRILRCLRVMGLQTECDAFYKALQEVFADPAVPISDRSMMYWTHAVQRPLYIAPDDDRCEWLKVWEDKQMDEQRNMVSGGE